MPEDEARSLLGLLEDRIASSNIEVQRRDALIRLRQVIEEELAVRTQPDLGSKSDQHAA